MLDSPQQKVWMIAMSMNCHIFKIFFVVGDRLILKAAESDEDAKNCAHPVTPRTGKMI